MQIDKFGFILFVMFGLFVGGQVLGQVVVINPGDILEIRYFNNSELNTTQMVRPDGKINLQLIHEVLVEGKTIAEIESELSKLYTPHLKYPDVTIIIRSLHSNRIYVGGAVRTPGFIELNGRMSVLEGILMAGGFDQRLAKKSDVILIRHDAGARYGMKINLKQAIKGKDQAPIPLQSYDIIYVPQTNIANVDQWIDQYINQLIPQAVLQTIPFVVYREYFND